MAGKNKKDQINLEDIKTLIQTEFHNLRSQQLVPMEDEIKMIREEVNNRITIIENDTKLAIDAGQENKEEIDNLKAVVAEQSVKLKTQDHLLKKLSNEVDDLTNRSLRTTLIFKNIPKTNHERSWDNTKNVLTHEIYQAMIMDNPNITKEVIHSFIERCHRSGGNNTANPVESPSNNQPAIPIIIAKISNWVFSEKIKSAFLQLNRARRSNIYVSQMHSKAITDRQNKALQHRMMLKREDPTLKGYVKYPAILMVKCCDDVGFKNEKEF